MGRTLTAGCLSPPPRAPAPAPTLTSALRIDCSASRSLLRWLRTLTAGCLASASGSCSGSYFDLGSSHRLLGLTVSTALAADAHGWLSRLRLGLRLRIVLRPRLFASTARPHGLPRAGCGRSRLAVSPPPRAP